MGTGEFRNERVGHERPDLAGLPGTAELCLRAPAGFLAIQSLREMACGLA